MFFWELDVLIQAVPDSLFRSARSDGESFTLYYVLRHLNVCKALDMFWCRWRLTDARGAVRYCSAFICSACLRSVLGRDVTFTSLLRDLSTFSVRVSAGFLCKRGRRAEV